MRVEGKVDGLLWLRAVFDQWFGCVCCARGGSWSLLWRLFDCATVFTPYCSVPGFWREKEIKKRQDVECVLEVGCRRWQYHNIFVSLYIYCIYIGNKYLINYSLRKINLARSHIHVTLYHTQCHVAIMSSFIGSWQVDRASQVILATGDGELFPPKVTTEYLPLTIV